MSPSVDEVRHVIHVGVGVAKLRLLATVPEGVVVREVCDFLAALAATYTGSVVD
jgi:hypothetical protein